MALVPTSTPGVYMREEFCRSVGELRNLLIDTAQNFIDRDFALTKQEKFVCALESLVQAAATLVVCHGLPYKNFIDMAIKIYLSTRQAIETMRKKNGS